MSESESAPSPRTGPVGCLATAAFALAVAWGLILLTQWLGWGIWPVPVSLFALAALLVLPMPSHSKMPSQTWEPSTFEKAVLAILAIATVLVALTVRVEEASESQLAPPNSALSTPAPKKVAATPKLVPSGAPEGSLVTPDSILIDYAENQVRAQRLYDREVRVRGRVIRVREALGTGILVLASKAPELSLELYFADQANEDLALVRSGSIVTATCHAAIEIAGAVALSDCRSIDIN